MSRSHMPRIQTALVFAVVAMLTAGIALAQTPPPRVIGSLQVDSITPAPLQVLRSVTLDATPRQVFSYVADHQNWPDFLGPIESVKVTGDGRKGSSRSFAVAGGGTLSERIVAFDEPSRDGLATFAYSLQPENPYGLQGHLAVLELRPADSGGTVLQYHQLFDHADVASVAGMVAAGTDEILSHILYRFGGELRGASHGSKDVVIQQRRVVDASGQRAWQVLGEQWGEVDEWASTVAHSEVSGARRASLKGATRSCEVPGTPGFRETMLTYDEDALTLSYQVIEGVPPFVRRATNTWDIVPLNDQRVVIHSRINLSIAPGTPMAAVGMVKGQFTQLLDLSFDELEHFVETRRPHPRTVAAQQAALGK